MKRAASRLGLASCLVSFALLSSQVEAVVLAPPLLFKQPFHQSPVRAEPGEPLVLAGEGFDTGDLVIYQKLANTTLLLTPPTSIPPTPTADVGYATVISYNGVPDSITIALPSATLHGTSYALWVRHNCQSCPWSEGVKVNDARPLWLTPDTAYRTASYASLPHQLKIVGRNLQPAPGSTTQVKLVQTAGQPPFTSYTLTALDDLNPQTAIERYVAKVDLPTNMKWGTYKAQVRRDGVSWVPLAGQTLSVLSGPFGLPGFDVASYGCLPNDYAIVGAPNNGDDTACFLQAIADADANGGSVTVGVGQWDVGGWTTTPPPYCSSPATLGCVHRDYGFVLPQWVGVKGSGSSVSTIAVHDLWFHGGVHSERPDALFTLLGGNTVSDLTFKDLNNYLGLNTVCPCDAHWEPAVPDRILQLGAGCTDTGSFPASTDSVIITKNVFNRPNRAVGNGGRPVRHLFVTGNQFQGAYFAALDIGGREDIEVCRLNEKPRIEDGVFVDNTFQPGDYDAQCARQGTVASFLGGTRRVDFSGNNADGRATGQLQDPDHPGWRAAFFWSIGTSIEQTLVSQNQGSCTGQKAGDGEFIAYDFPPVSYGFDRVKAVVDSTSTTVTVNGSLLEPSPTDYYTTHWVRIVDGAGVGQSRQIVSYSTDAGTGNVTFTVSPAWDVVPTAGSPEISPPSKITVARQYWQVYTVDNVSDQRNCPGAPGNPGEPVRNPNVPKSGEISVWGSSTDSSIDSNELYNSSGIMIRAGYSVPHLCAYGSNTGNSCQSNADCPGGTCGLAAQYAAYFDDLRDNTVDHEYDYTVACAWSGIQFWYGGDPNNLDPYVQGYGNTVANNVLAKADGLRGGAITVALDNYVPVPYRSTLIYGNQITDLPYPGTAAPHAACPSNNTIYSCTDNRSTETGIHLSDCSVQNTVIQGNAFSGVAHPCRSDGTGTVSDIACPTYNTCGSCLPPNRCCYAYLGSASAGLQCVP